MALPREVEAPRLAPPTVGLLASAVRPTDPDDRWGEGIVYEPGGCDDGGIAELCPSSPSTKTTPDANDSVTWQPYVVYATYKCSTFGLGAREWQAIARSRLNAVAGFQIERELWTGTLAQAAGWDNRYLADAAQTGFDILTPTAVSAEQGLACLEQYLGEHNGGQRGMIHATRQTVTHWAALDLVRPVGSLVLTINDTIVVPGAGYTGGNPNGDDPASGDVWAYATDMVEVRLSDPQVFGDPRTTPGQVDRTTNTVVVRAEQAALASWEGCRHAGARMDIEICDIGGS